MPVRCKGSGFDHYLDPFAGGPVETGQHEVQVDREGVHGHHFIRPRTTQVGQARAQVPVIGNPRPRSLFVTQHTEVRPVIELGVDQLPCLQWHQSQRVAAKVQQLLAARVGGHREAIAECAQLVGFVSELSTAETDSVGLMRIADLFEALPADVGVDLDVKTSLEDATRPRGEIAAPATSSDARGRYCRANFR